MTSRYPIPAQETRVETRAGNSRFVCSVAEARAVDEAQVFIKRVKAEFASASSHAYAYRVGYGASVIESCNDGGEPGGTAGKPMLAILHGSGLGDTVAVVSRWFGGAKLGTGGLVRAFGDALRAALDALPRAERVERVSFDLALPYALFERARLLVAAHHGEILDEAFAGDVTLRVRMPVDDAPAFERAMRELSAGAVRLRPV